jgi:hypothetical protein
MSYEESYAKAFPFDKMIPGMLDPEMIEDAVKIVNEAIKDKIQARCTPVIIPNPIEQTWNILYFKVMAFSGQISWQQKQVIQV